ncbi:MAG: hypothetical protein Q8P59_03810 [Dehalococcoidia bacterium]|nr:hypothetical protein [Dehalococcoidia bacterium]
MGGRWFESSHDHHVKVSVRPIISVDFNSRTEENEVWISKDPGVVGPCIVTDGEMIVPGVVKVDGSSWLVEVEWGKIQDIDLVDNEVEIGKGTPTRSKL